MNITDLPNGLKELALVRHSEEKNKAIYDSDNILSQSFYWYETKEGDEFWDYINRGDTRGYYDLYPQHDWALDYPNEYQVVADAYGNTIVAKVGDYVQPPFDAASAGTKLHEEVDKSFSGYKLPFILADGYYAGEDQTQDIKDAWVKGYEYACRNINLSDIMYVPNNSLPKNPPDVVYVDTAGIKESDGKTDYSEINFEILDLMAARFTANKHKYPKGNMLKPIDLDSLLWPIFRHWKKMKFPLKDDPETFRDHLSAIMCNCSMLLDQLNLRADDNNI